MTCIYCGGNAYTPYAYGCEHRDDGESLLWIAPEPEHVWQFMYHNEVRWGACGEVNDSGVSGSHPTREGAIAAWKEAWLRGRAVQVIFDHVAGMAREGAAQIARAMEAQRLVEGPPETSSVGQEPKFKVGDRVVLHGTLPCNIEKVNYNNGALLVRSRAFYADCALWVWPHDLEYAPEESMS